MKPIYNENGNIIDLSDEGDFVQSMDDELDVEIAISKLPPQQKRVAFLLYQGHTQEEVARKMKLSRRTIRTHTKRMSPFLRSKLV